jgi:hypothetical protein
MTLVVLTFSSMGIRNPRKCGWPAKNSEGMTTKGELIWIRAALTCGMG